MQAARLTIKNFMAIKELVIDADKFVQVTGANSQGKTSVLKAIETIFTGSTDGRFIKHGEDQAELILELPDETIRRTLRPGGHSVSVTKGEFKVTSPQTYLEQIMDFRAFNPLSFLDPKNRKAAILEALAIKVTPEKLAEYAGVTIQELPPVDFEQDGLKIIDKTYDFFYARRAEANKDALNKKNEYEVKSKDFQTVEKPPITKEKLVEMRAAYDKEIQNNESQISMATVLINQNQSAVDKAAKWKTALEGLKAEKEKFVFDTNEQIEELGRSIISLREKLKMQTETFNQRIQDGEKFVAEAEKEIKAVPDVEPFKETIRQVRGELVTVDRLEGQWKVYDNNALAASMVEGLKEKWEAAVSVAEKLNKNVENLKESKNQAIRDGNIKLGGLEYFNDEYYVNGTRIDELSTSESVMLGLAVAQVLAKKTKLICIDQFESLDQETRKRFIEQARPDEFIYFFADVEGKPMPEVKTITMQNGVAV